MTPMDSSTSSFSEVEQSFPDAELLEVGGTTCECYRVKLYGKLHFLKRLKPELRTHPQYAAALQKEFELGYPLEHPHLVRYTAKTPDGILMEYVDGETLSEFAEHHPDYFAKREQADRFLQQLLSVVGYLHSHQIVHLDLKPGNILITRIGHDVKLIDLGYSYADCYTDTTGHTDKYAAPEQKYGTSRVDARTDIYAIGRILQTLPCAHYYNKVIKRCTEEQMYLRYSSIDELRRAVSPRRNHRWILAVIVMVIVFLAGFLLYRQAYHAPVSPDEATTVLQPEQDSMAVKESPTSSNPEITDRATTYELPPVSPPVEPSFPSVSPVSPTQLGDPVQTPAQPSQTPVQPSQTPAQPSQTPAQPSAGEVKGGYSAQREDTMAIRRRLQQLIGPRFKKALGHYNDSIYYNVNQQRYTENWIDFEESIVPLYTQIKKAFQGKISEHTIATEWCQTILYYKVTQLWQMMRNDPNHDPFYDGKVFHYYDIDCY